MGGNSSFFAPLLFFAVDNVNTLKVNDLKSYKYANKYLVARESAGLGCFLVSQNQTILAINRDFCDTRFKENRFEQQQAMSISRFAAIFAIIALSGPSEAGDPHDFPDFTFKMSAPPKPGTRKRITVQIDPEEQKRLLAVKTPVETPPKAAPVPAPVGSYGWFWDKVSPAVGENPAERFVKAVNSLSDGPNGGGVAGPRLQALQKIAQAQGANILSATIGTKVSPALVLAIISVESGGRTEAVSGKGAQGLMQLMPDTAKRFGVTDSLSSAQNIKGGVTYLNWLLGEFEGDAIMAIAGYNAGENAVKKHAGVPPYAETRDYVPKVLAAFEVAKGLCKTCPELVSDGCALTIASN